MPVSEHNEDGDRKVVCVMDASSYLGLWLVQGLLQNGYTVHAALKKEGEIEMESLRKAKGERLKIYYADGLDYHSIANALKDCQALFYTFDHPHHAAGYQEVTAEIEVQAAHNALEACAQTETIEKVVFTSSISAVVWRDVEDNNPATILDERHWSDPILCKKLKLWHALAKTLSERAAWALAMDRGVDMVSINAALAVGPGLLACKTTSSIISYLKGAGEMYEKGVLAIVDVRHLVNAHICALEDPKAYGRYLCFTQIVNSAETALHLAQTLRPLLPFPDRCEDENVYSEGLSNKKLASLMASYESHLASEMLLL